MNPVCFLDMDGVLVDFTRGAMDLHGRQVPPGQLTWNLEKALGFERPQDFWDPLGQDFWAGLPWTSEGRYLLTQVENLFGDRVVLLTSPCLTPGCAQGKLDWVRREIPHLARRVLVGPAKHLVAGPGKVLLDDHDPNVESFRSEGGHGVLVPRPWNSRRHETCGRGGFSVARVVEEIHGIVDTLVGK